MEKLLKALESREMNATLEVNQAAYRVLLDASNYVNLKHPFTMIFLFGLASEIKRLC